MRRANAYLMKKRKNEQLRVVEKRPEYEINFFELLPNACQPQFTVSCVGALEYQTASVERWFSRKLLKKTTHPSSPFFVSLLIPSSALGTNTRIR